IIAIGNECPAGHATLTFVSPCRVIPRESVWSRGIGEGLKWRQVTEALKAGSIVVGNETGDEVILNCVRGEKPMSYSTFGLASHRLDDATVEAFDHAICLRTEGPCQAMWDVVRSAGTVERMAAGGLAGRLVLHVDGKTVSKFAAVVGEDRVNG